MKPIDDILARLASGTGVDRELDRDIAKISSVPDMTWIPLYTGSLDECRELHDALLPGWFWSLDTERARVWNKSGKRAEGHCDEAGVGICRAWLMAILKAETMK